MCVIFLMCDEYLSCHRDRVIWETWENRLDIDTNGIYTKRKMIGTRKTRGCVMPENTECSYESLKRRLCPIKR